MAGAALREAVLRREVVRLSEECSTLRTDYAGLVKEVASLRQQVVLGQQQLAAVYASRSWRMAAPVRLAGTVARRLLGRDGGESPAAAPAPSAAAQRAAPAAARGPSDGRREILVVADFPPLFDQHSGGLRLHTLIRMMGEGGWRVVFGSFAAADALPGVLGTPEGRARYEAALREAGAGRILYGLADIDDYLKEGGGGPHSAFVSFPTIAREVIPLLRSRCPNTRVIFDMVDFHGLRVAREAAVKGDTTLQAEAERQRELELACARSADVTLAITLDEKRALLDLAPEVAVEVLPNVFELPPAPRPGPEGREGIFFVGGFWHQPNGDAMTWFVGRIWPLIRQAAPEAVLRIAGSNMGEDVLALGKEPGVELLGFVPDLAPLFDRHRVFVAPLRYGAGMKGKVGQSLAYGLPVVATAIGAEGMGLADGRHILVADEEEAFAGEVLRLMRDDALWTRLADEGRLQVERTLSVEAVRRELGALLDG